MRTCLVAGMNLDGCYRTQFGTSCLRRRLLSKAHCGVVSGLCCTHFGLRGWHTSANVLSSLLRLVLRTALGSVLGTIFRLQRFAPGVVRHVLQQYTAKVPHLAASTRY